MSDAAGAIAQLAYTADELEMLLPLIQRVPDTVLEAPIVSLAADADPLPMGVLFGHLADRDEWMAAALRRRESLTSDRVSGVIQSMGTRAVTQEPTVERAVGRAIEARRELVDQLGKRVGSVDEDLLFGIVHADANVLRAIAYALHGAPVTGGLQSTGASADTGGSEGTRSG